MNKKLLNIFSALLLSMFVFTACSEDDAPIVDDSVIDNPNVDNPNADEDVKAAKIVGVWKYERSGGYSLIWDFKADGTGTIAESLPSTSEPYVDEFAYQYTENEGLLEMKIYMGDEVWVELFEFINDNALKMYSFNDVTNEFDFNSWELFIRQ